MSTETDKTSSSSKTAKKSATPSGGKKTTAPKKRKNSRAKGAAGELEFAKFLTEAGFDAHRTQQFCGRGGDSADVVCSLLKHLHFEVKRVEALSPYKALEQAQRDSKATRVPVVAHRTNARRGMERPWLAILTMKDFLALIKTVYE
jgi:hypothetical protein